MPVKKQKDKRDLLSINDLTRDEVDELLEHTAKLKKKLKKSIPYQPLKGKTLAMIFSKSSTRTRVSFEVGMSQLGGQAIFLTPGDIQLGRGEPLADTARTLSRYVDGILIRTYSQDDVVDLARYADVPVINGLTDLLHPCQILSDIYTIVERRGSYQGLKVAHIGDGNNVANTWIQAAALLGFDLNIACPPKYQPDGGILDESLKIASSKINILHDPREAVKDVEVINTDVWTSMGQEAEQEQRLSDFQGFQVNHELLSSAPPEAVVMHCLPAHRGEEITEDVLEGKQSIVFDQAENRLHLQKAILEKFL
ncbi:MAG: ornithine carbamoyltransferase [Deltaproteobacteria bacterium]|nr:MAG: ornithine carbamoyltransferase [Deltaproteobacteria bacterium]